MKARLLAVLLVSALVLASATPVAFAQAVVEGDGDDENSFQYVDCSQVQAAVGGQYGGANAAADDESTAEAANELNITQNQVNACLGDRPNEGNGNQPGDGNSPDGGNGNKDDDNGGVGSDGNNQDREAEVMADTFSEGTLPETGGPSLLAAVAGAFLVVGGVSLIRVGRGR